MQSQSDQVKTTESINRKNRPSAKITAQRNNDGSGEKHLAGHKQARSLGDDTRKLIKEGMRQDRICGCLEESDLDAILATMEYYSFSQDEMIVTQGQLGNTFFVAEEGRLQVVVDGKDVNTLGKGDAFGGLALLYDSPRTASVRALEQSGIWGANGETFHKILQGNADKHQAENKKFLDSIGIFDSLTSEQKSRVGESCVPLKCDKGSRIFTEGEAPTAIYFVKTGKLEVFKGGSVENGMLKNGTAISRLAAGDCFGERALLHNEPRTATVVAQETCDLLTINVQSLQSVLGDEVRAHFERNYILLGLKKSPRYSHFSGKQHLDFIKAMTTKDYAPGAAIEDGLPFVIIIDGSIKGVDRDKEITLVRGQCYEEGAILQADSNRNLYRQNADAALAALDNAKENFTKGVASAGTGARLAILTPAGLAEVMKAMGSSPEALEDYTRKTLVIRKVPIFRHLAQEQTDKLVKAFTSKKMAKGDVVIKEGDVGNAFYVIANGEVAVFIKGEKKRTQGKNGYFGERALLFAEPRTATVEVSSTDADLWSIDKTVFLEIIHGKMHEELMRRIGLQDTSVGLKDLAHVKVIGTGAAGVVRLVEHKKTKQRYALKQVKKVKGEIPKEVQRECALLEENDHPFIVALVKTFKSANSIYMLQECLSGGELHDAIRRIPTVLSRAQGQFYTGSLVLIINELSERNIVYRDLKPENVMLDQQGYLKLIDFGIAKKLSEGKTRTYTMVGTPHYMAPEVMRGHGYGTEVDLWSIGIMLFEFVCGLLPFADDLDDPTEVCRAVLKEPLKFPRRYKDEPGMNTMTALLCRQPKKRLGAGINGFEDVRNHDFFVVGYKDKSTTTLFDKIMGRELDPPIVPKGEVYGESEDVQEAEAKGGWSDEEV